MGNGNKKVGDSPLLFLFNVDLTQITYRFITEGVFLWEPAAGCAVVNSWMIQRITIPAGHLVTRALREDLHWALK